MKTRQDIDLIVKVKGIPLKVVESFVGGIRPTHYVNFYYPDGIYMFQTDAEKSYTLFLRSHTVNFENIPEEPVPLWFKDRYPDLNRMGILTASKKLTKNI